MFCSLKSLVVSYTTSTSAIANRTFTIDRRLSLAGIHITWSATAVFHSIMLGGAEYLHCLALRLPVMIEKENASFLIHTDENNTYLVRSRCRIMSIQRVMTCRRKAHMIHTQTYLVSGSKNGEEESCHKRFSSRLSSLLFQSYHQMLLSRSSNRREDSETKALSALSCICIYIFIFSLVYLLFRSNKISRRGRLSALVLFDVHRQQ